MKWELGDWMRPGNTERDPGMVVTLLYSFYWTVVIGYVVL